LHRIVHLITADRKRWVRTTLTEEYGLPYDVRSPWLAALSTFTSFSVCGLIPLLPYFFPLEHAFVLSLIVTGAVFFTIGTGNVNRWRNRSESRPCGRGSFLERSQV